MTEKEISALVDEVLRPALGKAGFDRADVRAGLDHDGEKAIFVTAHFKPGYDAQVGKTSLDAMATLRNRLLDRGEERFPYLDFRYPDDEPLQDEDIASEQH